MIEVQALSRRYGATHALRDVSFRVAAGQIVGFLGPNGAGKTTAMRILTGSLAPSGGRALVDGHDVATAPMAVRRRIGFMPENVPLYPEDSVRGFLRFVARLKGVPARGLDDHLAEVERRCRLEEVRDRLIGRLSKGYRQRVGLAQALVGDPPILILDEPGAGLDPQQTVEMRELIRALRGRRTVLLSSHLLAEVSQVCEQVLILDRGRLIWSGAPEAGLAAGRLPASEAAVRVAWTGPREAVLAALAAAPGVAKVVPAAGGADVHLAGDPDAVRPRLAAAVLAAGGALQELSRRGSALEDLFLGLTGAGGAAGGAGAGGFEREVARDAAPPDAGRRPGGPRP